MAGPAPQAPAFVDAQGRAAFVDPTTGEKLWVPKANVQKAVDLGLRPQGRDEYLAEQRAAITDVPGAALPALAAGALRAATLGGSDVALSALGGDAARDILQGLRQTHPIATLGGELVGTLAPGGAVGFVGRAAGRLGRAGTILAEGAASGVGTAVTDIALDPHAVSADDATALVAKRAVLGAGVSGVLSLAGLGIGSAAKRLVSRTEGSPQLKALTDLRKSGADDLAELQRAAAEDPKLAQALAHYEQTAAVYEAQRLSGATVVDDAAEAVAPISDEMTGLVRQLRDTEDVLRHAKTARGKAYKLGRGEAASSDEVASLRLAADDTRVPQQARDRIAKALDSEVWPDAGDVARANRALKAAESEWLPVPEIVPRGMDRTVRGLRQRGSDPRLSPVRQAEVREVLLSPTALQQNGARVLREIDDDLGYSAMKREAFAQLELARRGKLDGKQATAAISDLESQAARLREQLAQRHGGALPANLDELLAGATSGAASEGALVAAREALEAEAIRVGLGRAGAKSGIPVAQLSQSIERMSSAIRSQQRQAFGAGFGLIGAGAGAATGVALDSVLGGGIAAMIGSRALPWAGRQLQRLLASGNAKALGSAFSAVGRPTRLAATDIVSRADGRELHEAAAATDPETTRLAALDAYTSMGVDPADAEGLAAFQAGRHAALADAVAPGVSAVSRGRTLRAVADPPGIVRRLAADELTREDVRALQKVSPALYRQLARAARAELEEDQHQRHLSAQRRSTLRVLTQSPARGRMAAAYQATFSKQRQQQEDEDRAVRARSGYRAPRSALDAMAKGGGPGLR